MNSNDFYYPRQNGSNFEVVHYINGKEVLIKARIQSKALAAQLAQELNDYVKEIENEANTSD